MHSLTEGEMPTGTLKYDNFPPVEEEYELVGVATDREKNNLQLLLYVHECACVCIGSRPSVVVEPLKWKTALFQRPPIR